MIEITEAITQGQLVKSSLAGRVNVVYPAGSSTWLEVNTDVSGVPVPTLVVCVFWTTNAIQLFFLTSIRTLEIDRRRTKRICFRRLR